MLLIGFTWIFVAMAAGILVSFVVRGPWEAAGPAAIMVAAVAAFFRQRLRIARLHSSGPLGRSEFPGHRSGHHLFAVGRVRRLRRLCLRLPTPGQRLTAHSTRFTANRPALQTKLRSN